MASEVPATTLFWFPYSCYSIKVHTVLALREEPFRVEAVPYGNRSRLAQLTGGYVHVPVVLRPGGTVLTDSRDICSALTADARGAWLVPEGRAAAAWALADWADQVFEDVAFRLASPWLRDRFADQWERALFVLVKERRWGAGAIDRWREEEPVLVGRAQELLAPAARDLAARPFLLGDRPGLADAALYGQLAMLRFAAGRWPAWLPAPIAAHAERMVGAVAERAAWEIARL